MVKCNVISIFSNATQNICYIWHCLIWHWFFILLRLVVLVVHRLERAWVGGLQPSPGFIVLSEEQKYFVKSVEKRNSYVFYCFCLFFYFVPERREVDPVCREKLLLFYFFLKQLLLCIKNSHWSLKNSFKFFVFIFFLFSESDGKSTFSHCVCLGCVCKFFAKHFLVKKWQTTVPPAPPQTCFVFLFF